MFYNYFSGPSALTVNITKNITNSSVVVQWDTVDDVQDTNYTVTWAIANESNVTLVNTEQTSYTLTGLTLNTVYNINVTATNKCGQGDEVGTSVSLSEDTTSSNSGISPYVTTVNRIFTVVFTIIPTSVIDIDGSSTAKSSFTMVTPPTANTVQSNEFSTSVSLSEDNTSINSGSSPTITTANHTFTIVPTIIPTSVTNIDGSNTAKSSFASVTPPTASTAGVPVTATSDSVLPTPTTYFTNSK